MNWDDSSLSRREVREGSLRRPTPVAMKWEKEAPPGFEPGMADLQSAALPLGEGAVKMKES